MSVWIIGGIGYLAVVLFALALIRMASAPDRSDQGADALEQQPSPPRTQGEISRSASRPGDTNEKSQRPRSSPPNVSVPRSGRRLGERHRVPDADQVDRTSEESV